MSRFLLSLTLLSLAFAGCLGAPTESAGDVAPAADAPATNATAPVVHEWSGYVIDSMIEGPTHMRPSEDVMWSQMQEGMLFNIEEVPQAFEVALSWDGPGEFMIMLHSHKEHGSNAYVEHISALDGENPKCIRVPTEDLTAGVWQIMVHSENARDTTFTLNPILLGGKGAWVEDDRHGHWLQDGMFEVEEHEVETCSMFTPEPAATA